MLPQTVHTVFTKITEPETKGENSMRYQTLLTILILIALAIVVGSGFNLRGDVVLGDYSASEDGSAVTMQVGVAGSMGYVRSVSETHEGDRLYVKFYSAFGGYNGTLGAKDSFELETPQACREIWFYRDGGGEMYDLVLRRDDAASAWVRVDH